MEQVKPQRLSVWVVSVKQTGAWCWNPTNICRGAVNITLNTYSMFKNTSCCPFYMNYCSVYKNIQNKIAVYLQCFIEKGLFTVWL